MSLAPRPTTTALLILIGVGGLTAPAAAQLTDLGAHVLVECDPPGDCLANEAFGAALAVCDFDDDGFADLAVGVPEETVGPNDNAGSIHVFYGSSAGLTSTGEQVIDLDDLDLSGGADAGDQFGDAFAAGDFDLDGICDLAVGAPGKSVGAPGNNAGAVVVLFGSAAGLDLDGFRFLSQNDLPPGSSESSETEDEFGAALAALPGGGLAVGVPGEDFLLPSDNFGIVQIFDSSAPGHPLDSVVDRDQGDFAGACPDGNEGGDQWGYGLAVGRFDGSASLVVAGQFEDVGAISNAGRVTIIGSPVACFDQNTSGVIDSAEDSDLFGRALSTGDFDGDGFDDLAIGAPQEQYDDSPLHVRSGGVHVLFGGSGGLTATGDLRFSQIDFPPGLEDGELNEQFGDALASGDFDGDGLIDLAIGVPHEEVGGVSEAGEIHVLYGDPSGFDETRSQTFHSNSPPGMPDSPNAGDHLGDALAAGDFDGNGTDDLAIGAPGEGLGAQSRAGAVTVLYGLDGSNGAFGTIEFSQASRLVTESAGAEVVVLVRSGGAVLAATVDHSRTGGTATPGSDFTYTAGSESWGVGDVTTENFVLQVEEDTLDEPDETLVIALSNPSTGTALGSPSTFTLTITDNDVAGAVSFVQPVFAALEDAGVVQLAVTRTGGAASGVTVHFATSNASATAGSDYTATSGTLTFGAGETSKLIPVTLLDDGGAEANEVFLVTLSNPAGGATLGNLPVAQVVLVDDEIFLDGFEAGNTSAWDSTIP